MGYRKKTQVTSDIVIGQNDGQGNTAGGEMYRVRSKSNPEADYFTDDLDDAEGTAMAMAKVGAAPFEVTVQFNPFTTFRRPRESLFAQGSEEDEAAGRVRTVRERSTLWFHGDPENWTGSHPMLRSGNRFAAAASWTLMNGHPALRVGLNVGAWPPDPLRRRFFPVAAHDVYIKFAYIAAKHLREGKLTLLYQTDIWEKPYAELPFLLAKESVTPALIGLDDFLGRVGFAGVMT